MRDRGASLARVGGTAVAAVALVFFVVLFLVAGGPAVTVSVQAQAGPSALGYSTCGGSECHSRSGEIDWLTSQPGGREHRGSLGRLRGARDVSTRYARAVGLSNFEEPTGMCVRCHGTFVARARTLEGVGCEGCHGVSAGYREFHAQAPRDYPGAVQRGLRDLKHKPAAWIAVCLDCHVLTNRPEFARLLDEGHKDGGRWNPAQKYEGVQAHWKKVTYTAAAIAAAGGGRAIAAPPANPPAPSTAAPPAPLPSAAAAAPKPSAPPPASPAASRVPPPATAAPAVPVAPLPPPPAIPAPVTSAGLLAALQDKVAGLLESMLRRNAVPSTPLKPLGPPPTFTGPDADLLRLQYETLQLAIEALNLRVTPAPARPPR